MAVEVEEALAMVVTTWAARTRGTQVLVLPPILDRPVAVKTIARAASMVVLASL